MYEDFSSPTAFSWHWWYVVMAVAVAIALAVLLAVYVTKLRQKETRFGLVVMRFGSKATFMLSFFLTIDNHIYLQV